MTDLEITKLCAEAIGLTQSYIFSPTQWNWTDSVGKIVVYDPLRDDAQAMGLVKYMGLCVIRRKDRWLVHENTTAAQCVYDPDLNRAICECVAKMQRSLAKAGEQVQRSTQCPTCGQMVGPIDIDKPVFPAIRK